MAELFLCKSCMLYKSVELKTGAKGHCRAWKGTKNSRPRPDRESDSMTTSAPGTHRVPTALRSTSRKGNPVNNKKHQQVLNLLTEAIQDKLRAYQLEYSYPTRSPDESDDFLKMNKEQVRELRRIRGELELVFTDLPTDHF